MKQTLSTLVLVVLAALAAPAAARQARFDDVVRNLRNPDPKARMEALRMLREAQYVEAIAPIAPLVNDPVDAIQLEAIAAELSFYLVEGTKGRRRVAFIIETRSGGGGAQDAFEAGPLAVWPRAVPPELSASLLKAIDDEHPRVRIEALFAFGAIMRPPLSPDAAAQLVKALDHYDPAIRAGAARVIGRLKPEGAGDMLLRAVTDSQPPVRFAAMRALGELRDATAVQALVQQLEFYRKGEGAWSALDALARIAHPSTVPLFTARLADRDAFVRRAAAEGLGRAGDATAAAALDALATGDRSDMVRAAAVFALVKVGKRPVSSLIEALASDALVPQVAEYLMELGPAAAGDLVPFLRHTHESVRGNVAAVLGAIGSPEHVPSLEALAQDRNRDVQRAAARALERIRLRTAS